MRLSEAELTLSEVMQTISGHMSICSYGCNAVLMTDRGVLDPTDGTLMCPLCGELLQDYSEYISRRAAEFHI